MEQAVLFGCGKIGMFLFEKLQNQYDIVAFLDNNKKGTIEGRPIISIDDYKERYKRVLVLIGSNIYADEMITQLKDNGIVDYMIPDELYEDEQVKCDKEILHDKWIDLLVEMFDKEGMEVLEVGSRHVVDVYKNRFKKANYTGFDYYPGENVDVVGDAHKLTEYFSNKRFDLIYSSAVFEHLAMPWIASIEMIKLLKLGGCVFVETHYSYSSHERPWHFFQFSENALNVLFPECFGIECINKGCDNLISGSHFSNKASEYLRGQMVPGLYCHSKFLGKKVKEIDDLDWSRIRLEDVSNGTEYPKPKTGE